MPTTEVARYSAALKNSFAYNTTVQRWPTILTQVVDGLFQQCHALSAHGTASHVKVEEAKSIIEQISQLKYELTHNKALTPIGKNTTLLLVWRMIHFVRPAVVLAHVLRGWIMYCPSRKRIIPRALTRKVHSKIWCIPRCGGMQRIWAYCWT